MEHTCLRRLHSCLRDHLLRAISRMCPVVSRDPVGILVMSRVVVCQGPDKDAAVGMIGPATLEAAEAAVRERCDPPRYLRQLGELEIKGERVRKVERMLKACLPPVEETLRGMRGTHY